MVLIGLLQGVMCENTPHTALSQACFRFCFDVDLKRKIKLVHIIFAILVCHVLFYQNDDGTYVIKFIWKIIMND